MRYDAYKFVAASSAVYDFTTIGTFDTFVFLYDSVFSPLTPLSGVLAANDDASDAGFNQSGLSFGLKVGHGYTYVVTGFDNDEFGAFETSILSRATAVPEPATWLLFGIGFGAAAIIIRSARVRSLRSGTNR